MTLILFFLLPLFCVLAGKLAGLAVTASLLYSDAGKALGASCGRWCMALFPVTFLLLMVIGVRGNAGHGFTLFGSQALFDVVCGVAFYSVPVLAAYVGVMYVVRDLTIGHRARS